MRKLHALPWLSVGVASVLLSTACEWDPSTPFERYAPQVDLSISLMDGGDAKAPVDLLTDYLTTGVCDDGSIASPQRVRDKPRAAFDLGLALFRVGELYGRRFGEEEAPEVPGKPEGSPKLRELQAKCATTIATAVAKDASAPWDLRSRAFYLLGNLAFFQKNYTEAIEAYDEALRLAPAPSGEVDAGVVTIGRVAAWNRAVALRRRDDPKDGGTDAAQDASQDASSDAKPEGGDAGSNDGGNGDGGGDAGSDGGNDGGADGGQGNTPDGGDKKDGGDNAQQDAGAPPPPADGGAPPPPQNQGASLDERMLDELERIPSVQKENAKLLKKRHRPSSMEDK